MQKARRHSALGETPTACKRTVSGSLSPSYSECFSPFLHSTGSLSVSGEYLALADGPAKFTQDFSCPALLRILPVNQHFTCTGLSPPSVYLSRYVPVLCLSTMRAVLLPQSCISTALVWAPARSLATTCGITFVFFSYGY